MRFYERFAGSGVPQANVFDMGSGRQMLRKAQEFEHNQTR
jgi:hypothetical protein